MRGRNLRAPVLLVASLALAPAVPAAGPALARVTDLRGRRVSELPLRRGPAVLVFTRTDCPLSNRYAPEIRRLDERFRRRGVAFRLVYVDPSEPASAVRDHVRAFASGADVLLDPGHELVRWTGATVTPEAVVVTAGPSGPEIVYRGRIDDRAVELGVSRPQPRVHDLADVLEALASGRGVVPRTTKAVGCFIPGLP